MTGERPLWKDISSFSRGQLDRSPTTWELRLTPSVRVVVTMGHIYCRESWVMHCPPWFDTKILFLPATAENCHEAQAKALALVRQEIDKISAALRMVN